MTLKWIIIISLIFLNVNSFSQYAEFKYWKELCTCKSKFDSTKITREQLQNTFDYLWWAPNIDSDATAWTLETIEELSVNDLRKECSERIEKLQTLDFVNDTFCSRLRDERINYYENNCRLREFTILAYSNPDTLLHYDLIDSTCVYYRTALITGGQTMIEAWVMLNGLKKGENKNPDKMKNKFDKKYNSPNRLEYARLDLMKFGWWNSANHRLPHINTSYNFEGEFERLLIDVDCECDEP